MDQLNENVDDMLFVLDDNNLNSTSSASPSSLGSSSNNSLSTLNHKWTNQMSNGSETTLFDFDDVQIDSIAQPKIKCSNSQRNII